MNTTDVQSIRTTLDHHDRAIANLGVRMGNVETRLGEIGVKLEAGFDRLTQQMTQQRQSAVSLKDAVSVVLSLAVLFSMVVGGIIWVTTSQFSGMIAKQESTNAETKARLEKHDAALERLTEFVRWRPETRRTDDRNR